MNLEKRNSYTSKSILSVLQTTTMEKLPKSNSTAHQSRIPSIALTICSLISLWAILFFFILGICYYFNSGILVEDLNFIHLHQQTNVQLYHDEIRKQFSQLSFHCFFAVCGYLLILVFCLVLFHYRQKQSNAYQDPK